MTPLWKCVQKHNTTHLRVSMWAKGPQSDSGAVFRVIQGQFWLSIFRDMLHVVCSAQDLMGLDKGWLQHRLSTSLAGVSTVPWPQQQAVSILQVSGNMQGAQVET